MSEQEIPAELLPHAEAWRDLAKRAANSSASLEQTIEKVRDGDRRRGILIEGPAGSGKSVLSQVLLDKLQRRLTDGRVVWFGARDLAQQLSGMLASGPAYGNSGELERAA